MDTKTLIEIAEYLKSDKVADELKALERRLQDDNVTLTLPLVGEFSSGKTSLINALTDSKQLEIATKPTTATIYLLHFGQDRQYATIHRADGSEETVEAIGSLKNSELADVPLVDIYDTSTRVPRDLILVDTPGLSSPDARHKDALIRFLPEADAILMTVDCNQQITKSLLRFIEESNLAGRKVYLIVTKCDTKPASDRKSIKRYIVDNSKLPMEHIVCVSAQQDDLAEFYALIKQLSQSKREILAAAIRGRLESLKEELKKEVNETLKLPNTAEELKEKRAELERQEEEIEREIKHLISSVRSSIDDVSDEVVRSYQDLLFRRLDALINQRADNMTAEANTIIQSASLKVMTDYRRKIVQEVSKQTAKASSFIQSAVNRLDLSGLEAPEQSMNIDLDSIGHEHDKMIAGGLQLAAAAATLAAFRALGAVGKAAGTVGEAAGTVGEAAGTVGEAADTIGKAAGTANKLSKSGRVIEFVQKGAQVATSTGIIDSQMTPKVKGFVEGIVSTFTDRMAKPKRLRATHDFIELQLAPVFAEQMQQNGRIILGLLQAEIAEEAKGVSAERKARIADLTNDIDSKNGEYQQKMDRLKAYNTILNS
ncbi:dynamin family protein [Tannerella serpentiformis]|nr:dynamin family protein [Tannerella serpentiformis]